MSAALQPRGSGDAQGDDHREQANRWEPLLRTHLGFLGRTRLNLVVRKAARLDSRLLAMLEPELINTELDSYVCVSLDTDLWGKNQRYSTELASEMGVA